jgi:hypothetical protein
MASSTTTVVGVQSHHILWNKIKTAATKQQRHTTQAAVPSSPAARGKRPSSIRRRVIGWIFKLRWTCLCGYVCLDNSDTSNTSNINNTSDTISKLDLVVSDDGDSKYPSISQHLPLDSLGYAQIDFQKWLEGTPKPFDARNYKAEVSRFSWTTSATSLEA